MNYRNDIPDDIRDLLKEAHDCLQTADAVSNKWLEDICIKITKVLA